MHTGMRTLSETDTKREKDKGKGPWLHRPTLMALSISTPLFHHYHHPPHITYSHCCRPPIDHQSPATNWWPPATIQPTLYLAKATTITTTSTFLTLTTTVVNFQCNQALEKYFSRLQ